MHPGSIHYGIEPFAYILADVVAKYGLKYGKAFGGVTTLSNAHCILYLDEVETSVMVSFAMATAPDKKFGVLDFLILMVPDGGRKYPLHVSYSIVGEERVKLEIGLFRDVLASGVLDAVLGGDESWIPSFEELGKEYDRLKSLTYSPPFTEHLERPQIRRKQREFDLTWMDDVRRILAEQESQS